MTMTAPSPVMNAILDELRMQPDISYADLKARLSLKGYVVLPILYGRAKLTLGLLASPASTPHLKRVEEPLALEMGMAAELPLPEAVSEDVLEEVAPVPEEVFIAPHKSEGKQRGRPFSELSKFMEEFLKSSPEANYAEASAAAAGKGLAPNLGAFSRTKARLGLGRRARSAVVAESSPRSEVRASAQQRPSHRAEESGFMEQLSGILASARASSEAEERLERAVREAIAVLSAALEPDSQDLG